jgi:phytoene dehydrogenase-like protein
VAAALLGRAGRSVLVLERSGRVGGAAVSERVFAGLDARVSRYSYLVSLFPAFLLRELGVGAELRRRRVASYTPVGDSGVLSRDRLSPEWDRLQTELARRVFPTLTEPLRSREEMRELVGTELWELLFERPLSEVIEAKLDDDVLRGVALTDGTIGTFAPADDVGLRQNRCFLYHVNRWDVPVGGIGALSSGLEVATRAAGAAVRTRAEVTRIEADGRTAVVSCADGDTYEAAHVLAGVAPFVLARLLGEEGPEPPEGSQLKLNMLLRRLPRLRDSSVSSEDAFTGTFHVNEGYEALQRAYEEAASGRIPTRPPCELYCHSLTDPTVLSPELQAVGMHTLTLFGLHMPARLFADEGAKRAAVAATVESVGGVLAEPLEDCLALDANGAPCLEAHTPPDLEAELAMPGGHIFHRDLSWPYAESEEEVGDWGVETPHANVWLCGAGARRGGCVSGIPGHNAARAVLEKLSGSRSSPR